LSTFSVREETRALPQPHHRKRTAHARARAPVDSDPGVVDGRTTRESRMTSLMLTECRIAWRGCTPGWVAVGGSEVDGHHYRDLSPSCDVLKKRGRTVDLSAEPCLSSRQGQTARPGPKPRGRQRSGRNPGGSVMSSSRLSPAPAASLCTEPRCGGEGTGLREAADEVAARLA
jgi:hypothetical protein